MEPRFTYLYDIVEDSWWSVDDGVLRKPRAYLALVR